MARTLHTTIAASAGRSRSQPRPKAPARRRRWRSWVRTGLISIPLVVLVLWTLIPFLVTLSISLKPTGEVFAFPGLIPRDPTFDAYADVIGRPRVRLAFLNSVVVGIGTTVMTLAMAIPTAYAFARFNFRGRHLLLLFTLLPRLVPSLGLMVPLYRLAASLGMLDQRLTLITVYSAMLLPLAVWLLTGFFQQIPRELEEAASVDGASLFGRLRYIMLPLAVPAIITVAVLAFREAWNEFTLVLVLTTTPGKRTLPYELYIVSSMGGGSGQNFPVEAAFAILTVVPFILVYTRIERFIVQGITTGSSK